MGKGSKNMTWSAVIHVVLVQARGLMAMDAGETSDPYCKIALGRERHKSKSISSTVNPKWREAFDLYWYVFLHIKKCTMVENSRKNLILSCKRSSFLQFEKKFMKNAKMVNVQIDFVVKQYY